jgi:integrase
VSIGTATKKRAVIELIDSNDLVFTWPDGRPLHPDLITDWFQRHAKRVVWEQDGRTKVGLPPIRLHDVRHSYATAALAAGIPAKIVSDSKAQRAFPWARPAAMLPILLPKRATPPQLSRGGEGRSPW